MTEPPAAAANRSLLRGLLISIALNAIVPVLLYQASKRYAHASELAALTVAASFPLAWSLVELGRVRSLDPAALLSLAGIVISMVAVLLGGTPKLLLIRESLFTGTFGIACLVSLVLPRPVMFYFARYFSADRDPARIAAFDAGWVRPGFRHTMRVMTAVWGVASLLEFALRVVLVETMPAATVLVVSPAILGVLLVGTISWTFAYGRRRRARAEQSLGQGQSAAKPAS
jgi:hypothetical protein